MCEICLQNPCDSRCPNNDEEPEYICEMCDADIWNAEDGFEFKGMTLCEKCFDEAQAEEKEEARLG